MVKSDSNIVVNYSSIFLGVTLYVCNVLYCTVMVWYGMVWYVYIYIYIISYLEDHPTTSE